jgi:hypothetical protein
MAATDGPDAGPGGDRAGVDRFAGTGGAGVSVVIPCYSLRRWAQLVAAVDSVRAQTPRPAEIVVSVDHNEELLGRARQELTGVTVLANRFLPGASGTRNTGVLHTTTPLVALLDDDAWAHPGWLAGLLAPFSQAAVIGTGGAIVPRWPRAQPAWFPNEFLWAVVATEGLPPTAARVRNVWSVSMALRREAFDAAGGFRLGFGKRGERPRPEDTELCLRMSRATGGDWVYVPDAVVDHCVPRERATVRYLVTRCYHEGRGKVELARLAGGAPGFDVERRYVSRTLPQAFLRDLGSALRGRGTSYAWCAGIVLVGTASAVVGALVEFATGWAGRRGDLVPVAPARTIAVSPTGSVRGGVPEPVRNGGNRE